MRRKHIYLWMLAPSQLDPDSIRIVFSPAHRIFAIAYGIWPALTVYVYPGLTVCVLDHSTTYQYIMQFYVACADGHAPELPPKIPENSQP